EGRRDSIAGCGIVLAGGGGAARAREAVGSLGQPGGARRARLMRLLPPPFDKSPHDPGYIRGYLPGVRENGAQYTHAALWAVLAMVEQGDADLAFEYFQMLNPLRHAADADGVATYQAEPYVVAADVYTAPGHLGRGGWSWYTGSAGGMYRGGLGGVLGVREERGTLRLVPPRAPPWARAAV